MGKRSKSAMRIVATRLKCDWMFNNENFIAILLARSKIFEKKHRHASGKIKGKNSVALTQHRGSVLAPSFIRLIRTEIN